MKKKGFTLIELIVVIAIIGVLAAILVPAMLGYVKKSKITSANSSAKSISTAAQSALTDMDTQDKLKVAKWDQVLTCYNPDQWVTEWDATNSAIKPEAGNSSKTPDDKNNGLVQFEYKIYTYFKDITKLTAVGIQIVKGNCEAVAVVNGNYPGCTPTQFSVDDYDSEKSYGSKTGDDKVTLPELLQQAGGKTKTKGEGENATKALIGTEKEIHAAAAAAGT